MYSVGTNPVLVGAAAVFAEVGSVPLGRCLGLLGAAICIIAWLNTSNDGFDASTGVDKTKAESLVNLTGGRPGPVLAVAFAFLAAGVALLGSFLPVTGDHRVAQWLLAAIAAGYLYQGPPFRLSYQGLGEPLCFTAFGPLATPAFYLALHPGGSPAVASAVTTAAKAAVASHLLVVPQLVWVLSVLVGLTTTIILFCSHFHQVEGDIAAGKRSPLVRLGTARACQVLRAAVGLTYALLVAAAAGDVLSPWVALATTALSLPAALALIRYADANHTVPAAIAPLKKFAIKWHLAFDLSLAVGLVATRYFSGAV